MSAKWPPAPDLESLQQLVREADIEGHLAEGAPEDEYEPEEEELFAALSPRETEHLTAAQILPVLLEVWRKSFSLSDAELAVREPKLKELAVTIERFFGPDATPQVRGA
jgi:hypothetical protein